MTGPRCFTARGLAARRAAGLSSAERLVLEQHVGACASCNEQLAIFDLVKDAVDAVPTGTLSSRDRALRRALTSGADRNVRARAGGGARWWVAGAAAVAIATAVLVSRAVEPGTDRVTTADTPAAPPAHHVMPLADAPIVTSALPQLPDTREQLVAEEASFTAGPAVVRAEPGTRVVWRAARATLELLDGVVMIEVAATQQPFRVATPEITVEVTGTMLVVDRASVRVLEGTARVFASDGRVLAAMVEAGETWTLPAVRDTQPTLVARLARARAALARGATDEARAEIDRVLRARPRPGDRAAAMNLRAECALVDGDRAAAVVAYLEVAREFPSLSAGENALFAAARLESRSGATDAARALLREYMDRYPRGRFLAEATERLEDLGRTR